MSETKGIALITVAALGLALGPACADGAPDASGSADGQLGSVSLALGPGEGTHFSLRIFASPADVSGGKAVFDTGCVEAQSRTYELTNIPVGDGRVVMFEGFGAADCGAASRTEIGYRGGVSIRQNERPYYHIPVYVEAATTPLPEAINLSAATATAIDFCDADADCAGTPGSICYDLAQPTYWCVPSCLADSDCAGIHPQATCDQEAGWCMLWSPYPLNMSEPRAMGRAVTTPAGDVLLIGGFGGHDDGRFGPTRFFLERFDHQTGLFAPASAGGVTTWPAAGFGLAELGGGRYVVAGGVSSLELAWDDGADQLVTPEGAWADAVVDTIVAFDPANDAGATASLARPTAFAAVVALDDASFLVAGGIIMEGVQAAPTRDAAICAVGADLGVTCEGIAPMATPRFRATAHCLDPGCAKVLMLGGNDAGSPVAEVLDRSGAEPAWQPLTSDTLTRVFDPQLCGLQLVSGSLASGSPTALNAQALTITGSQLSATPLAGTGGAPWLGAVARGGDGGCWVAGGMVPTQVRAEIVRVSGSQTSFTGAPLTRARFAASAARIGAGPLVGKVVFAGGFGLSDVSGGDLVLVRGAEVLTP